MNAMLYTSYVFLVKKSYKNGNVRTKKTFIPNDISCFMYTFATDNTYKRQLNDK